jgi:hypothetical protein
LRNVNAKLNNLEWSSSEIHDGIVRGLDPHFLPVLANALELISVELPLVEVLPKVGVFSRRAVLNKHAMVFALDLFKSVSNQTEKSRVGLDNRPVQVELDHALRFANGVDLALKIRVFKLGFSQVVGVLKKTQ